MIATHYGTCAACNGDVSPGASIVLRKGLWIHATCAPGGDDD